MRHIIKKIAALTICVGAAWANVASAQTWVPPTEEPDTSYRQSELDHNLRLIHEATPGLDYGGAYGVINGGALVPNPYTKTATCPGGYKDTKVYGTYNKDYEVHICTRITQPNLPPLYDFGGMYGYVDGKPVANPATGQANCPGGYQAQQLLGTRNVDYNLVVCYKDHGGEAPKMLFGGIYGTVEKVATINPAIHYSYCPRFYFTQQVLGTYDVDWPMFFCFRRIG